MNSTSLILPALFALAISPVYAQCGSGHSSHGGNGPTQDHSAHQQYAAEVRATNPICPVMGVAVKAGRDREVLVRGNYYLVCCDGCGPEMSKHYEKYIDKDGIPLNDPKRGQARAEDQPAPAPSSHEGHQH